MLIAMGSTPQDAPPRKPAVLVFSKTAAYRHESIESGVAAITQLGADHGFNVAHTEDAAEFNDEALARFDVVIFLSTTGDVLDDSQQAAFEKYIRSGAGYVGIHAAADTEYDWPWYGELVGAWFNGHPPLQEAVFCVEDHDHVATKHLPERWTRTDEEYNFKRNPREAIEGLQVLLTVDESTYEGGTHDGDHPISWCREFDGGRSFYTALGHTKESFAEPEFLAHILGGIAWAGEFEQRITADDHAE
jgi:type 1 glutamine amidotransferase